MYDLYPFIYLFTPLHSPDHPGKVCMLPDVTVSMPIACILCDRPFDDLPGRLGYMADSDQAAQLFAVCRHCSHDRHDHELTRKIGDRISKPAIAAAAE